MLINISLKLRPIIYSQNYACTLGSSLYNYKHSAVLRTMQVASWYMNKLMISPINIIALYFIQL